jgi:hypothetical protein
MRRLSQDGGVASQPVRRHRDGRNVQLSLKVSAGVKEQFTAVAAAHGLAFGELLERALDAFVREAVVTGHGPLRNAGEFGDAHLSD